MGIDISNHTSNHQFISKQSRKKQDIDIYMRKNKVPIQLAKSVQAFYNYIFSEEGEDMGVLFQEMPESLMRKLNIAIKRPFIQSTQLFKGVSSNGINAVIQRVVKRIAIPGELVCTEGEEGYEKGLGRYEKL